MTWDRNSFLDLVGVVRYQFKLDVNSPIHGEPHWKAVAWTAIELSKEVGTNPLVGLLFGLFHDCCRENDGADPQHGPRAADLFKRVLKPGVFWPVYDACRYHTTIHRPAQLEVAVCVDADRLNYWRLGEQARPDPKYLTLPQSVRRIDLHKTLPGHDAEWADLYEAVNL